MKRNPINSTDVDGNTMAWMANKEEETWFCSLCRGHHPINEVNCSTYFQEDV